MGVDGRIILKRTSRKVWTWDLVNTINEPLTSMKGGSGHPLGLCSATLFHEVLEGVSYRNRTFVKRE